MVVLWEGSLRHYSRADWVVKAFCIFTIVLFSIAMKPSFFLGPVRSQVQHRLESGENPALILAWLLALPDDQTPPVPPFGVPPSGGPAAAISSNNHPSIPENP